MKITVAKATQTAIPQLGKEEKTLYYLIVENIKGKNTVLNVGEKTYTGVQELIAQEERAINFEEEHAEQLKLELEAAKTTPPVSKDPSTKGKIA